MEQREIDLKTFIIRAIAFHIKHWKFFLALLVIAILIGIFLITRPLKTSYQYYFVFGTGEMPANLVEQCAKAFEYDSLALDFKPFELSAISNFRKKGEATVIITSSEKLDIKKLAVVLDTFVRNCGLVKTYLNQDLNIMKRLDKNLKEIARYYDLIKGLNLSDKGFIYGELINSEFGLKKEKSKVKISRVELSNYYLVKKTESLGKRYVMAVGVLFLLWGLGYVILFFVENMELIKKELEKKSEN